MNTHRKALLIVSTASMFYFFMFLVRVMMASIMDDLALTFSLSDSALGLLSAIFVVTYSLSQIPSGKMIDTYGARSTLLMSIIGVIISTIMFQIAQSFHIALLSRAILGFSCGCAFIAPLSLTHQWLDEKYFSTTTGCIQMLGCLGAIFSGSPMVMLIDKIGWRDTVLLSAFMSTLLLALFYMIVEDKPQAQQEQQSLSVLSALKEITTTGKYWLIGLVAIASWAPIGGFTELWGVKYLMILQGTSKSVATSQLILTWLSIAISSPVFGYLTEYMSMQRAVLISYSIGFLSFLLLISGTVSGVGSISVLLFLMGIASGGQPVAFGMINRVTPHRLHATAVGFCNICVIAGAFIMQPLIGQILDFYSIAGEASLTAYSFAFSPILIVLIIGMLAASTVNLEKTETT